MCGYVRVKNVKRFLFFECSGTDVLFKWRENETGIILLILVSLSVVF